MLIDLIFIATNAQKFLDVSKELVVSVCVPPLILFSLLRHLKQLAYVALAADCMIFFGLAGQWLVPIGPSSVPSD